MHPLHYLSAGLEISLSIAGPCLNKTMSPDNKQKNIIYIKKKKNLLHLLMDDERQQFLVPRTLGLLLLIPHARKEADMPGAVLPHPDTHARLAFPKVGPPKEDVRAHRPLVAL